MTSFLVTGTILGLSAGFAPGPLLTLVISETLEHGVTAGVRVALAPVVTDLPVIALTMFIMEKMSGAQSLLGVVSLAGALFILVLGIGNLRTRGADPEVSRGTQHSFQKGIVVNALSPHPYLFWLSVGGPATVRAWELNMFAAASFVLSFYFFLVGSKVALAFLAGRSRTFLSGKTYLATMRVLGLILIVLAGFLFRDGLRLLGLV
jgi:threonine/homoserine/homoserine lactone efflux protein